MHLATRQTHDHLEIDRRGRARVEIGGQRHGRAAVDQTAGGRVAPLPQKQERAGQQCGHGSRASEGLDAGVRDGAEVIGGSRTVFDRQLSPAARLELVRMEAGHQAVIQSSIQHSARLLWCEDAGFHKHVTEDSQAQLGNGGYHLTRHQLDILVPAVAVLRRKRVGTQKSGDEFQRSFLGKTRDGSQHLEFVLQREPIAALDLRRRCAMGEHSPQAWAG